MNVLCLRVAVGAIATLALACGSATLVSAQTATKAPAGAGTAAPAKPAPISADPASTSATYGDWVLRCQKVGEGDKSQRVCEVAQTIQVQGQQGPIAQLAVGHVGTADPLKFTVALPANISLPGMVAIGMGDKDPSPMAMTWRRCIPGACIADAVPTSEQMKAFRTSADPGRLVFKDAAGRDVALPLSFRGLSQALDALTKA